MMTDPAAGIYRGVDGVEAARAVPNVDDVRHHREDRSGAGATRRGKLSGFIFTAAAPDAVERAEDRSRSPSSPSMPKYRWA
jgi:hypothetical protein